MKVLVTGATGFVGSHILDVLRSRGIPVAILLRSNSNARFLGSDPGVERRSGSILESGTLDKALSGISHVIHCAGCTKASRYAEYYNVNQIGTRNLVEALNRSSPPIQRLIHISSLAVTGPTTTKNPAREDTPLRPISDYGKSKLAGEREIRENCRSDYTILRPPAVYGPRDEAFLPMYRAVKNHILPRPSKRQELSLVFVKDLAQAAVTCLEMPVASRKVYFVASREVVMAQKIADCIAAQMKARVARLALPPVLLWLVCLSQEIFSRITGKPTLLNMQKFAELRAPGWVCDPSLWEREIGFVCATTLVTGIAQTLDWYRRERWL